MASGSGGLTCSCRMLRFVEVAAGENAHVLQSTSVEDALSFVREVGQVAAIEPNPLIY
jgi:hypothetical protein